MYDSNQFEEIKSQASLRSFAEKHLQRMGSSFVCPVCHSGEGSNHSPAFRITPDNRAWKCFSCESKGDIYDLAGIILNDKDQRRQLEYVASWAGISLENDNRKPFSSLSVSQETAPEPITPQEPQAVTPPRSFLEELKQYHEALAGSEGEAYLLGRGFTVETMNRFNLGYDPKTRTVTIPYDPLGTYYGRRSTLQAGIKHMNLGNVKIPLFNPGALYSSEVVFVVESPLCAISIMQAGGVAVALSGTSGTDRLINQLKQKPTNAALLLCLDNDEAGYKATAELISELDLMETVWLNATSSIMGAATDPQDPAYRDDPNEVLQKDGTEILSDYIRQASEYALHWLHMTEQERAQEMQRMTAQSTVDSFLEVIQTHQYEPISTGISGLDYAIDGGFMRQSLINIGAAPAAGKTALAQQIIEDMARRGHTCIYLNLEMSREQIFARTFSRMLAQRGTVLKTTAILQGYKWTQKQKELVSLVAQDYKDHIAPHLIYNPDEVTNDLATILSYIEKTATDYERAGLAAPFVCLDYLQLVTGDPREDPADMIKRAVKELKDYAIRHNSIVLVIVAYNRTANKNGSVTMEAGRDTSSLEYSADLQLGLTYTACLNNRSDKPKNPNLLTETERTRRTLKVVKSRFSQAGREIDFIFNGETMTFREVIEYDI